jgi:sensor domain CHASE-containing protein
MVLLQAAWPLLVLFGIYMAVRYFLSMIRYQKDVEQQETQERQQVNEDWVKRSFQQSSTPKDIIDVEYTERDADK